MVLAGCSDKLSESKADEIIKEKLHFPDTNFVSIEYGLIAFRYDSLPDFYYRLRDKGMFTVEHLGAGGFLTKSFRFRVTLTEEGKKFLIDEDSPPTKQGDTGEFMYDGRFMTSEVQFDKISSIHEIPSLNAADVSYTVKVTNQTPFWSYYSDESKPAPKLIGERKFGVIKTNDGWVPAR